MNERHGGIPPGIVQAVRLQGGRPGLGGCGRAEDGRAARDADGAALRRSHQRRDSVCGMQPHRGQRP